MLIKLNDLTKLSAQTPGDETGNVRGIYVTQEFSVCDIAVDFGSLLDAQVVALPGSAFGAPDVEGGTWPVDLTTDAIHAAAPLKEAPKSTLETIRSLVADTLPAEHDGLRSASAYKGLSLNVSDGPVGRILDVVVDTRAMTVPFIVVETGSWLPERQILLPMATLRDVNWADKTADVSASRADIENAPDVFKNDELTTTGTGTLMTYYGIGA